jgi:hypothetical protein
MEIKKYLINKMEKELQIIVSKIKYENFIFNYHTACNITN